MQPVVPRKSKKQALHVPDYLSGDWAKNFIPSITHTLFVSLEPFKDYKLSSPVFIATLQEVFSAVYPDINHKITSSDVIAIVVCNQNLSGEMVEAKFCSRHMTSSPQRNPRLRQLLLKMLQRFSIPTSSRTTLIVSNHTLNGLFGKMALRI